MKTCTKCKIEKNESEFYRKKEAKDGLQSWCKECNRLKDATPESIAYHKVYREVNRETHKAYMKIYWVTPEFKASKKAYKKDKLIKDPIFKLKENLRARLNMAIRGRQKAGSAVKDLGCTGLECRVYLEALFYPHPVTHELMTWNNYGKKWQIDHKVEFNSIDVADREQLLRVLHYSNLQPLWIEDHKKKSLKRLDKDRIKL